MCQTLCKSTWWVIVIRVLFLKELLHAYSSLQRNLSKIMEENQIKDGKSELCTFATANSEGKISWHYFSSKLGCHQTSGLLDCALDAEEVQFVEGLLWSFSFPRSQIYRTNFFISERKPNMTPICNLGQDLGALHSSPASLIPSTPQGGDPLWRVEWCLYQKNVSVYTVQKR